MYVKQHRKMDLDKVYYLFDRPINFYSTANRKTIAEKPRQKYHKLNSFHRDGGKIEQWEARIIFVLYIIKVINNFSSGPSAGSLRGKDTYSKCYFSKNFCMIKSEWIS